MRAPWVYRGTLLLGVALACGARTSPDDVRSVDSGATQACPSFDRGGSYRDIGSPGCWSAFDLASVGVRAGGFNGGTFDGRYVYFAANGQFAARYDTRGSFSDPRAWTTYDLIPMRAAASAGAVFDGRHVYFIPLAGGNVVRYDIARPFEQDGSWELFDTYVLAPGYDRTWGGVFDGRFVYTIGNLHGPGTVAVLRFDTTMPFLVPSSWSTFEMTGDTGSVEESGGLVFDGRYILTPSVDRGVARYDTSGDFTAPSSWTTYDGVPVNNMTTSPYSGTMFDGHFQYLLPSLRVHAGILVRHQIAHDLADRSSWSAFDLGELGSVDKSEAISEGAFDGRFVYVVSCVLYGVSAPYGIVRYDTNGPIESKSAWNTFDPGALNENATCLRGAVFDGEYMYFYQLNRGTILRFEARTPAEVPQLPAFHGSFF
jgi:hypothetical protein